MPKMQTSFTGLVSLLAKNLYTSSDAFIRELIQNAHDGCQRLQAIDPERHPRIDISTSIPERSISFADDGIGMDESDIHEYLSTIGRSGTATESLKMQTAGLSPETIGQFGVGLLSAFVVAERIDVFTRKLGADTGYHWVSHGDDEYQIAATSEAPDCGTEIIITLKREFSHYLKEEDLLRTVRLFADFLSIPIHVNGEGPVNIQHAPWHQELWATPGDFQEASIHFLKRRYQDLPLLVIPVALEQPRTRGVLYVTDQAIPGIGTSGLVDLYVRRMCVRLKDNELLPEWATFVRGVIDADLLPTAARDNVQRDAAYQRLRRSLGDLIVRALLDLQKADPDHFHRLCNWHTLGIKGMALRDESFFAAVSPHLPFTTNEGVMSLTKYLEQQKPLSSGRKPLYYFSFNGDETQFFQICSANGLLAINAGQLFDERLIEKFAQQQPHKVELRRLDHLNSRQIYAEPDGETVASFDSMLSELSAVLAEQGLANIKPVLRNFAPDTLTSVLLVQPGSDGLDRIRLLLDSPYVSGSMQDIAEEIADKIKSRPTELLINARNPLVQTLRELPDLKDAKVHAALFGLYHLAQLNSQSRIKPEHARKIDTFLQTQMKGLLQADQEIVALGEKLEAWRKCVAEKNGAESQDWGKITTDLVGSTPAEFRQRVTAASDAELGTLLLGLYHQMKQL